MKDLDEAQKAIEDGNALEPVLRKSIEELESDKKELKVLPAPVCFPFIERCQSIFTSVFMYLE